MESDKLNRISRRAYELWEAEGQRHGRHEDHWRTAERELEAEEPAAATGGADATDPHPGMMGDGTEEQNLGQPGHPEARITEDEVEAAFAKSPQPSGDPA